jgi:hypothetical protein
MKKIATIRTKFDLLKRWKFNCPDFLEKNKEKWEEVLISVTENEIQGKLEEICPDSRIEVRIRESQKGCWKIEADVFPLVPDIVDIVDRIAYLSESEYLCESFTNELNEKGKELLREQSFQPSDEEIVIDVRECKINPVQE